MSFEPFLDHEFLLGESKRLLGLPKAGHSLAGLGDEPAGLPPAAEAVEGGSD